MWAETILNNHYYHTEIGISSTIPHRKVKAIDQFHLQKQMLWKTRTRSMPLLKTTSRKRLITIFSPAALPSSQPLDLTEENLRQVLAEARLELAQLFDDSVGITGQVQVAEMDGPFVKISLKGRFWHKRSTVLARIGNYLKQRIPEILEVEIEDEKQLDDSPENF